MKFRWDRFKKPFVIAAKLILIFGIALLVVLYYFGYYDLSFIDRYRSQLDFLRDGEGGGAASDPFSALIGELAIDPAAPDPADPGAAQDSADAAADGQTEGEIPVPGTQTVSNVKSVWSADDLPDARVRIASAAELKASGRRFAGPNAAYTPGRSSLGRITFPFQLPEILGKNYRVVKKLVIEPVPEVDYKGDLIDYGNTQSRLKSTRELRPSVETYMGYLLIEADDRIIVCSSDGTPLCAYSPSRYSPAYQRDREGRPLFTRRNERNEDVYFYLSGNGQNFILSDFDPVLDSRGLRFDYPASFGRSDNDEIFVQYDAEAERYGYFLPPEEPEIPEEPEPEPEPEKDPDPDKDGDREEGEEGEEETGEEEEPEETAEPEPEPEPEPVPLTGYDFVAAYPFVDGKAAVVSSDFDGSLWFLREDGEPLYVFETKNSQGVVTRTSPAAFDMYSSADRYQLTVYCAPLTDGVESLGCYYYDHGLVRVRKRVIDNWWYFNRGKLRVAEEYSVLLREDGSEYELPFGFSLEGYSEGMLLLKRDGLFGFLSCTGEWIAQPIYTDAKPFVGGLAQLMTPDGRWGMIDSEGNIVLPFTYDSISQVSDGVVACWREENGWSVLRVMQ